MKISIREVVSENFLSCVFPGSPGSLSWKVVAENQYWDSCFSEMSALLTLQAQGLDEGVPLSNSVSVSDKPRVRFLSRKAKERGSADQCPFRHGE